MKLRQLLLLFALLFSFQANSAEINIIRFNNSASYTSGSGVSVIINPTGVFELNNQFILELSNPGGVFTSPTVLNTLDEFYVPAINGTLPNGLAAGSYKLRIRSTIFPSMFSFSSTANWFLLFSSVSGTTSGC